MRGLVTALLLCLPAAAEAGGWYLMRPPEIPSPPQFHGWRRVGAFDTAKECEAEREKRIAIIERAADNHRDAMIRRQTGMTPEESRRYWLWLNVEATPIAIDSSCVTTDDPRLR